MYTGFGSLFNKSDECIRDSVHFYIQNASEGYETVWYDTVWYGTTVRYDTVRYIRYGYGMCTVRVRYACGTCTVRVRYGYVYGTCT